MSLINDALRKVQNQRTQDPGLGTDTQNPSLDHTDRSNRTSLMVGLTICIIILIGLVAGLTVILINKDKSRGIQKLVSAESTTSVSESVSEIVSNHPIQKPAMESAEPGTEFPRTEKVEMPAAEPNQEIIDWLAQSKVTGVRITNSSSKVILNNEAFVPGNSVNMNLGLKILEIEAQRIILIDSNSVKYVKVF